MNRFKMPSSVKVATGRLVDTVKNSPLAVAPGGSYTMNARSIATGLSSLYMGSPRGMARVSRYAKGKGLGNSIKYYGMHLAPAIAGSALEAAGYHSFLKRVHKLTPINRHVQPTEVGWASKDELLKLGAQKRDYMRESKRNLRQAWVKNTALTTLYSLGTAKKYRQAFANADSSKLKEKNAIRAGRKFGSIAGTGGLLASAFVLNRNKHVVRPPVYKGGATIPELNVWANKKHGESSQSGVLFNASHHINHPPNAMKAILGVGGPFSTTFKAASLGRLQGRLMAAQMPRKRKKALSKVSVGKVRKARRRR